MSKYEYVDPVSQGYKRVYFTRKEHKKLFPKRKLGVYHKYEYYVNDSQLTLYSLNSAPCIIINTLLFPLVVLLAGLANFKEIIEEYKRMCYQKTYGAFGVDVIYSHTDTYYEAICTLRLNGQGGE